MHLPYLAFLSFALGSFSLLAQLENPIEKQVLAPINSKLFAPGLCPGNPASALETPRFPARQENDHTDARMAAQLIYALS
jgi:hypothetical protein